MLIVTRSLFSHTRLCGAIHVRHKKALPCDPCSLIAQGLDVRQQEPIPREETRADASNPTAQEINGRLACAVCCQRESAHRGRWRNRRDRRQWTPGPGRCLQRARSPEPNPTPPLYTHAHTRACTGAHTQPQSAPPRMSIGAGRAPKTCRSGARPDHRPHATEREPQARAHPYKAGGAEDLRADPGHDGTLRPPTK